MLPVPFLSSVFSWFHGDVVDDAVDRFNHSVTASVIAFLALMVSAKQ